MLPHLTPRLLAVAAEIPEGSRLADVGTDHAYLPAYLTLQGQCQRVIATDLRPGPLGRAAETVERYGVEERVELRLCDGLSAVAAEEVDAVSIAGMGGEVILGILQAASWTKDKRCVVQPMSSAEDLRKGLGDLGLHVAKETLVREGRTIYVVMTLLPGAEGPLTAAESWVGRRENHGGDPLWGTYLARHYEKALRALEGLKKSQREEDKPRMEELEQIREELGQMMTDEGLLEER